MAVCYEIISIDKCNQLLCACGGLAISKAWRSVEPCILLEAGRLSKDKQTKHELGRVTFMLECDWRIERPKSIEVGSGFSPKVIDRRLASLIGVKIVAVEISGVVPEIAIRLDDRRTLRTFTNWNRQPQWSIGFDDFMLFQLDPLWRGIDVSPWVSPKAGRMRIEYCYDHQQPGANEVVRKMGFK